MRNPKKQKSKQTASSFKENFLSKTKNQSALVFVFSFLLYANTIKNDFALDDRAVTYENKFVKKGVSSIPEILKTFYWQGFWDNNSGLYRPLSLVVFAIEWQLFPKSPHIYHFVQVLLYSLMCVVLFRILKKLFEKNQRTLLPLCAALLFAAHPVHTEVGANIKSMDEVLCFLFFLLSLGKLLIFHETQVKKNLWLSVLFFGLSLFSKEGGLLFIFIYPLAVYFFTDISWKQNLRTMIPFAAVLILWLLIHEAVIRSAPSQKVTYSYIDNSLVGAPDFVSQKATAVLMLGKYLKLLIFPHPLSYDYSFSEIPNVGFANAGVLVSLLVYSALIFFAVKKFPEKNILSFSILFFLITISLTCNLFVLIGATFADRFLFVPSLGFCIATSFFILKFSKNKSSTVLTILIPILALYSFKTFSRNKEWENDFSLFETDIYASPGSARVHYNYGTEYMSRFVFPAKGEEKVRQAKIVVEELKQAVSIDPKSYQAQLNLAAAYFNAEDFASAATHAAEAIKISDVDAKPFSILGSADFRLQKNEDAVKYMKIAIEKGLAGDEQYNYFGGAYFGLGDYANAAVNFEKSVQLNPQGAEAWKNLGSAYGNLMQWQKSLDAFNKVLQLEPNNPQSYYFTAITYSKMGDTLKAKEFMAKHNALVGK